MATINGIPIYVLSETRNYDNEVSDHPVETGFNVSDHVEQKPTVFNLRGEYTGPDAGQVDAQLRTLRRSGELVNYVGRGSIYRCAIQSYSTEVDSSIANGFRFNMTIKEIRIAQSSTVNLLSPNVRAQVREVGNAGRVQVV
ncbi:hypothetical protein M3689_05570 [Alkalihalophilus marmarensis]|uniref:phage baseplate protein n=1 Tax=Alkalihalophilus marmarensis TaxID=521377 RepID=UPI0020408E95|nr:hypothetical protein [Alkalihalophilus marmarensis]MCM3488775.1 hypothetical protein [Alkalihalophilus marmarensis]